MGKIKEECQAPANEFTPNESEAFERQEEEDALLQVFEDVRQKSRQGLLAQPSDWVELDCIPPHMDFEEFEMCVYAYLEEYLHQRDTEARGEPEHVFKSASTAVGVSQIFLASKEEPRSESEFFDDKKGDSQDAFEENSCTQDQGEDAFDKEPVSQPTLEENAVPPGFELVELEGELTLLPLEEEVYESSLDCCGIAFLEGKYSYYLYDKETMTDAYARWAFLSAEDDRIATFVECVRSESKTYPRPMPANGFENEPFSFSTDEVDEIWQAVSASQEYPDIQITIASNGASYYFSTDYLTPVYAASLAEWEAVERRYYL